MATVAAICLVAVATASDSHAQTHAVRVVQKAVEAPRPATVQVACPTATSCVSVGGSAVLVERGGKWRVVALSKSLNILSLACPSAGKCVASGREGERRVFVLTQIGRKWGLTVPALPGNPADPSFPALRSVTCTSRGNCVAVGYYEFAVQTPVLVKERNGTWGDGAEAPLPANAATSPDPDHPNAGGFLALVSCSSGVDCTAAGGYTNKDAQYGHYGWFLRDAANPPPVGETQDAVMAQLPADAATVGDPERAGSSPFFGFAGMSCPLGGYCTAAGGYVDTHDDERGVIFTETPSGWARGITPPLPANAGRNPASPNEFENPLASLSCAATANCAATGWYVDRSEQRRGLLLSEAHGKWKATELVLPVGAARDAIPILGPVTCASRGNCVAIGDYASGVGSGGRTYGLIVVERAGTWGRGIKAAPPANASKASHTFLNSVSCASARTCTIVGDYQDRSGRTRGLILNLRLS
jgi:putative hemolysin